MKQRLNYIDYAKTIAIVLICIGHFLPSGNFLKVIIYSFHVPVFFFISGYTFTSGAYNCETFILKKAKRILIPYILFFCISSLIYIVRPEISFRQWISYLFFLNGQTIWNAPLWFLPAMFMVNVLFFIFEKNANNYKVLKISILSIFCFLLTMLFAYKGISIYVFGINKVIHMLGYMGIGYLIRHLYNSIYSRYKERINHPWISLCALIVFAAFCWTAYISNKGNNISVLSCDYNNIFIYIPLAIVGSISFTFTFYALYESRVIHIASSNTLFIMSTHYVPLQIFLYFRVRSFRYCLLAGLVCAVMLIVFCLIWSAACQKYKLVRLSKYAEYFGLYS